MESSPNLALSSNEPPPQNRDSTTTMTAVWSTDAYRPAEEETNHRVAPVSVLPRTENLPDPTHPVQAYVTGYMLHRCEDRDQPIPPQILSLAPAAAGGQHPDLQTELQQVNRNVAFGFASPARPPTQRPYKQLETDKTQPGPQQHEYATSQQTVTGEDPPLEDHQ